MTKVRNIQGCLPCARVGSSRMFDLNGFVELCLQLSYLSMYDKSGGVGRVYKIINKQN